MLKFSPLRGEIPKRLKKAKISAESEKNVSNDNILPLRGEKAKKKAKIFSPLRGEIPKKANSKKKLKKTLV